jgi:large subunit ribosomal protein L5e
MTGDKVMCAADSTELKTMGLTAGLTNYSAAYCTGLLIARRLLKQVKLDSMYSVNGKVDGEYFNVEDDCQEKRPFKAFLDVGTARTTTGSRIFGALKGACDGGINVPHNTKRFPGFYRGKIEEVVNKRGKATGEKEKTKDDFNAKVHRDHIFGCHVTTYMNALKKENAAKFKTQFSQWEKCLTAMKAKTCEDVYKKVHAEIQKAPERKPVKKTAKPTRKVVTPGKARVYTNSKKKWLRHYRLSNEERKARVQEKFAKAMAAAKN